MKNIMKLLLISIFLLPVTIYQLPVTSAYAEIPRLINYQGKLTDSTDKPLTDGVYKITFRLYETEGGGSAIWTEVHDPKVGTGVTIQKGIFNTLLGGVTALNLAFDKPYWLSIQVGSDAEMAPRQRIASSAYALRANVADNADTVDGFHASQTPAANQILALDSNAKLPAVDGSQLTNIPLPKIYMVSGTDVLTDSTISSRVTLTASNVAGQKAYITFMGDTHTYNNQVNVSIQVDGVTKATSAVRASDHGDHYSICTQWVESPSAGSHTYRVTSSGGFGSWNGYTWSLVVLII
jgi:hypothetical protein